MLGQPKPADAVTLIEARHMFEGEGKTIRATQGGGFNPTVDIPRYVKLWEAGLLNLDGIITDMVPLSRVNDGLATVRAGAAGRILITL